MGPAAPVPDPRLGGRLVLRDGVEADAGERTCRRAVRARGWSSRGGGDSPGVGRGPRTEERPGALRARAGRRRRRSGDPPRRTGRATAGGAYRHASPPVRGLRRGLPRLGPFAPPRGGSLVRGPAGRGARLPGREVPTPR